MTTYKDFDRIIDNDTHYLCKDTWGRKLIDDAKKELDKKFQDFKDSLQDRYVLIGDSYLEGYTPDGNVESFGKKLQQRLKKSDNDFIMKYKGGCGFKNTISGVNFNSLLNDAYANTKNPETISHVIFAGGYNDSGYDSDTIQSAMNEAIDNAYKKFPNCTVYVANIATAFNNSEVLWHLHDNVQHAYNYSGIHNAVPMAKIGDCLHERGMLASDGYHPTDWGQGVIASAIYYGLHGQTWFPVGKYITFTTTNTSQGLSANKMTGQEWYTDKEVNLVIYRIDFTTQPSTLPNETNWSVGNTKDFKYLKQTYATFSSELCTATVAYNGGANFKTVPVTVGVNQDGYLFVRLHNLKDDHTGYEDLPNVKFIAFDWCTIRIPISFA